MMSKAKETASYKELAEERADTIQGLQKQLAALVQEAGTTRTAMQKELDLLGGKFDEKCAEVKSRTEERDIVDRKLKGTSRCHTTGRTERRIRLAPAEAGCL